ncbi:nucleic-acid-binding protein from transposon X-element [Trichonephila clavipes]|nr:nucleic-acid-binding protein from transposon X-element [Trichonephila clavipes]
MSSATEGFESKGATQCFQCNQFNHTAENCHLIPRCLKCGEEHQTRDCQIKRLDTPYCINCKTYGHMANYSKCHLFPKPRKGTALKTNYTNTVNSIVRPNTSYAQITKNTLHSANPQQMAPPDTNMANISQHSALEITPPAHIPTPSSNGYNECLNLITQTLQNTIQALTQLSGPPGEEDGVVVDPIAGLAINHRRDNSYESDRLKFPTRRLTLSKPSDFVNNIYKDIIISYYHIRDSDTFSIWDGGFLKIQFPMTSASSYCS